MSTDLLLFLHLLMSAYMTGVIWLVQLVVYPQFARVSATDFVSYHSAHSGGLTRVVMIPMAVELGSASVLLLGELSFLLKGSVFMLTALIWLWTAGRMVPLHHRLSRQGWDPGLQRSLVQSNWIRTAAWSLKTILISAWLCRG